jgi:CRP-like cAMP-binding protein
MALDDDIATLSRAPLFSLMERDALRLMAFAAEHKNLRANAVLFRKGDRSDGGFVVSRGSVALDADDGRHAVVAGAGALIGQTALFIRHERPANAVAREPTALIRISPTLMRRVLEEFPATAAAIQQALTLDLSALTAGLERVRDRLLSIEPAPGARDGARPPMLSPASSG